MPHYMFQGSYTAQAWKTLLSKPVNRFEAVKPVIENLGGKPVSSYWALGEHDFYVVAEFPNSESAAAFAVAATAGGAVKCLKTVALMTMEEGMAMMKKAGKAKYHAPGK
jgi:uncharacterized protein with GYD domain